MTKRGMRTVDLYNIYYYTDIHVVTLIRHLRGFLCYEQFQFDVSPYVGMVNLTQPGIPARAVWLDST